MSVSATEAMPAGGPAFLITVDTEGDNLWSRPREITTRNVAFLPRFQRLCDDFGFKPTWLVNHEMASCHEFVLFGRDVQGRGHAEIGMHLHAWNSPPVQPLTDDDFEHQPYLIEYPADLIEAKIAHMTQLLRERFEAPVVSHRAGRWAMDATYARALARHGYLVDCSVSPHVSWADAPGAPQGAGGSDYRHFPDRPYLMDLDRIDREGTSPLLELPVSVLPSRLQRLAPWAYDTPGLRRWAWRYRPRQIWLYPDGRNLAPMRELVDEALDSGRPYIELILHSSDLMPGGSPNSPDTAHVEALYRDLRLLFSAIAARFTGMTLAEFRRAWLDARRRVPAAAASGALPAQLQRQP